MGVVKGSIEREGMTRRGWRSDQCGRLTKKDLSLTGQARVNRGVKPVRWSIVLEDKQSLEPAPESNASHPGYLSQAVP